MLRFILCFSLFSLTFAKVLIGDLVTKKNGVKGTLYAVNTRTFRLENFFYNGKGTNVEFLATNVTDPTENPGQVLIFKANCTTADNIYEFKDATLELELTPAYTIDDVRYFSIYERKSKSEFGGIEVDSSALKNVIILQEPTCPIREQRQIAKTFEVEEGWNCEPLNGKFQVRWRVVANQTKVNFELVARLRNGDQWMAFGPSGSPEGTDMVGGDAAVAFRREKEFFAFDYHLESRNPCEIRTGMGVCPDTARDRVLGRDDVTDVSGAFENEITMVRYTRPVKASNPDLDKDIVLDGPAFVVWAYGPLKVENLFPLFHLDPTTYPPKGIDVSIEFGREPINKCFPERPAPDEEPTDDPGFERPVLYKGTTFNARIGPSGGVRGVSAITNKTSLSVAWYLSEAGDDSTDILIPALGVQRGKTYTFNLFGGIPSYDEDFFVHPFYITDSEQGGYEMRTPQQRAEETVYAGIADIKKNSKGGVISFRATGTGHLCEITTNATDTSEMATYTDFHETLNASCASNPTIRANAGKLVWKVAENTKDIVYYQSVNNVNMGFKIQVFSGKVDVAKLERTSGGGPIAPEEAGPDVTCIANFKGERERYDGCRRRVAGTLDVFWNINETKGEFETLIRAPKSDELGYIGIGWGFTEMVGSSAVIAFERTNGVAGIGDYFLESKSSAGVQPNSKQDLISSEVDNSGDFLEGRFTRRLEVEGLPTIKVGLTDFIWAIGPPLGTPTTLQEHRRRGGGRLDLSKRNPELDEDSDVETEFIIHAVLMGISWLLLVPIAITVMRFFKKYNPVTFNIHRGINSIAALLTIAAFIIAIVSGNRTETTHLAIGCVVFSLVIVQVLIGAFRPHKDRAARKAWFWVHFALGSVLSGLGIANCFVGIGTRKIGGPIGWYVAAGVVTGVLVIIQIVFALMPKTFPRTDEEEEKALLRAERTKPGGRTFVRDD